MNLLRTAAGMAILLTSWVVSADHDVRPELFGSYFEASYLEHDVELAAGGIEPDGYKLNMSIEFTDLLYGIVERGKTSGRYLGTNYDFKTEAYGFGLHGDHWFTSYTYGTWDMDGSELDVDTLRLGFRRQLLDRLQFNASYSWNDFEDADNEDGFQVGLVFSVSQNFHLVTSYESIGGSRDVDHLTAGIRLTF